MCNLRGSRPHPHGRPQLPFAFVFPFARASENSAGMHAVSHAQRIFREEHMLGVGGPAAPSDCLAKEDRHSEPMGLPRS